MDKVRELNTGACMFRMKEREGKEMGAFFQQFLVFAFLAGFGFMLARRGALSSSTTNELSYILISYFIPLLLFHSFLRPFEANEALALAGIMLFTVVVQVSYIFLSRLIFGVDKPLDRFAVIFNNKAFVGVAIATAFFGPRSVFYIAPSAVVSNLFIILYGTRLLDKNIEPLRQAIKKIYKQPIFLSFFFGWMFYLLEIPLPEFILKPINALVSINSTLAMIVLGAFIAQKPLSGLLKNKRVWLVSSVRLLLFPLVPLFLFVLFPFGSWELRMVTILAWSCPSAINLALQAKLYGYDTYYASQIIVVTSIGCAFTIPLIMSVAQQFIH